ncbi:3-ketoacyl-CoA thiolase, mitochondrial-like isoform X1 [Cylas formicarius]|uniref:3-ketoacyl-CoA thiolase, mitochondrial-like isoform X1 n=1 Tax=Cylas formicarius TaxID=197179 RepID=UPI0029584133|nr:3-ketoacyl-CoA thiolase, mitochondrial-like isoform X1 [Cylas formicarius]
MSLVKGVVIVAAKRTAFGKNGGKLKNVPMADLQTMAARAALASATISPDLVDTVVIGNVHSSNAPDGIFLGRHVLLRTGVPTEKTAMTVNRLCGSGFQAIVCGVQDLLTGAARVSLTGGVENMSATPYMVRGIRHGIPLGTSPVMDDTLWVTLTDTYCGLSMAMTGEVLGERYGITRDEVDEYALTSQKRWKAAQDGGRFAEEMVPVRVNAEMELTVDEHPRPESTIEGLKKLPSVFKKDGLVTAGSASGICDGAGAVVIATDEAAVAHNLKPLARIVGYSIVGVEPSIMGIGPAPAIRTLLKAAGKTLDDIDLVEINEAFGAQTLACAKDLGLDLEKLNVDGGAIALGHPLAASGSRIMAHLVHELRRRKAKYGIGSACIGGGQGIALMVEALK